MAKRQELAAGGDPSKTTTLLDLLEIRRLISRVQSDAGRYFGWLRRQIYGRTQVVALDPNMVRGRPTGRDRDDWVRLEAQYGRMCKALSADGAHVRKLTEDLCIYDRCDGIPVNASARTAAPIVLLRRGLDTIERVRAVDQPTARGPR